MPLASITTRSPWVTRLTTLATESSNLARRKSMVKDSCVNQATRRPESITALAVGW
jgi:hypothetical protein